jgi:hypothetical protein
MQLTVGCGAARLMESVDRQRASHAASVRCTRKRSSFQTTDEADASDNQSLSFRLVGYLHDMNTRGSMDSG